MAMFRSRGLGDQGREGARLHGQCQRHDLRRSYRGRRHRQIPRLHRPNSAVDASRFRGVMPMSARPTREHFLNRTKTKRLFRDVFASGKGKKWNFMHSGLFLELPRPAHQRL